MASVVPEADMIKIAKSAKRILEEIAEHVDMASAIELMLKHDTLGGLTFIRKLGKPTEAVTQLNYAIDGFAQDYQKCRPVCEAFRQAITTDGWKIVEDMAFGDAYLRWMDLPMQQDLFMEKRHYSKPLNTPIAPALPLPDIPHVTVIRPVKGVEPYLYECLAATFHQTYPSQKLTVYFCISTRSDPAYPTLECLISDFPTFDASILVEDEDPNLSGHHGSQYNLGPNPKIRNMSRAYREAKGDILWIIDCNVWVSSSVAGLMVDRLCGFDPTTSRRKYKFVHQLPLVVDVSNLSSPSTPPLSNGSLDLSTQTITKPKRLSYSGGLLEALFLSTSHAKFYTAISTVAIAP
ncbi:MAG: hypothetical protein Q9187_007944, partial [Circinaria calcarea]